jgi:peptidyl-dipeptidase A
MKKTIGFCCLLSLTALATMLFTTCRNGSVGQKTSAADSETFIKEAENRYLSASIKDSRASWVQSNFITEDTEAIAADSKDNLIAAIKELTDQSRQFDGQQLSPDVARKIKLLKLLAIPLPAPSNPAEREKLTKITVGMESAYGKFKYCPEPAAAKRRRNV